MIFMLVSLIDFQQALRLSQTSLTETSPGKVVNLLSNDLSGFEVMNLSLNALWIGPFLSIIVAVLLWREIGYAGLIGIAIILFIVQTQSVCNFHAMPERANFMILSFHSVRFYREVSFKVSFANCSEN